MAWPSFLLFPVVAIQYDLTAEVAKFDVFEIKPFSLHPQRHRDDPYAT